MIEIRFITHTRPVEIDKKNHQSLQAGQSH